MSNWESVLKADPIKWLLEKSNPSVRYLTLTEILDMPGADSQAIKAQKEIMAEGTVPQIMASQKDEGYWENPKSFYTAKYKGSVWQLLILAELGADGNDPRIKKACEFIFENSQDRESHGFSMNHSARTGGGRHSEVIPCLTGNMVWALIKFGYLNDSRIVRAIDWITTYQRFDDGTEEKDLPQGWPYDRLEICWGRHTCHMAVAKTLKALAAIPPDERSGDVTNSLEDGVEYLLKHRIYKRSHDLSRVSKPGWLRFGFPLMYQTDVLEILGILTDLGCRDERMQEAIDLLVSKQDSKGRWTLKNTFNGRFQVDIEEKGKPSKWITLNALRVLKKYYS
jgi:hypothetical protein